MFSYMEEKETKKKQKHTGFSLIELIVVAGIIALIATFVIISVSKARVAVRDAKRTDSVRTMVLALEQYYNKYKSYPTALAAGTQLSDSDGIVYMEKVPSNPAPRTDGNCPDADFYYESFNGGKDYMLTFCLASSKGTLNAGVNYYQNSNALPCDTPITDRDGYTYTTVAVGGQCWMAENLKTKTKPDGTPLTNLEDGSERDCMSSTWDDRGTDADCDAGRTLYTLEAAMNGETTEGVQGLCPDGWHIPKDSEWHTLEAYLSDSGSGPSCDPNRMNDACSGAGTKMLPGGSSGLNIAYTGTRVYGGHGPDMFIGWDSLVILWSSTLDTSTTAYGRYIGDYNPLLVSRGIWGVGVGDSTNANTVRCIKNYQL